MAGAADYQLREYVVHMTSTSIGASPVTNYVSVPFSGTIVESMVTTSAAITTTDSTTTFSVLPAGVVANAITVGGTLIATVTGAGIGKTYMAKHTSGTRVSEGDSIRIAPAGGGGASVIGNYAIKIRR